MTATNAPPAPDVKDELAAAMAWWREAGVDMDFTDDATSWLQDGDPQAHEREDEAETSPPQSPLLERKAPAQAPPVSQSPRVDFFADSKPQTIEEFREFWLTATELDPIGPKGRVPPRGSAGADLMVLVVDPEPNDSETLLSGPQGRFLERILKAIGTAPEQVYFASALPRHTPMADTAAMAGGGLDSVLHHHIALAKPRQVLAFGAKLTPFIAQDAAAAETSLHKINYNSALPPLFAGEGLDSLIETPPLKARFWRRWMDWSSNT
ncbi:MAG: uracil-DNA glycosylase family protein [Pseudomonadota bacterium]